MLRSESNKVMNYKNKKLIQQTKEEFSQYKKAEISDAEACEIINNFSGFAKLLLELDKKRNAEMEKKNEK